MKRERTLTMKRGLKKLCLLLLFVTLTVPAFAGRVLAEIEYFYADDGTLIGKAFNGKRVNFEYDLRGQLLAVKDAQGKDLERYTYDPAGNRLSKRINGVTTTYTYDKANQLVTSTVNGITTHYKYDAAGRMIQAGDKSYIYNGQNKVSEVRQNGKTIAKFEYNIDGQIAKAIYGNKVEEFMWDGLALIWRSGVTYINEPYVTGGNPVMAGDDVLFNDMLGSTLAVNDKAVEMTSFGETADKNAFFTGKPMVDELGYSFLFRDYNPNQGKWTTTDPLGYPDGWNNLAYCNNGVTFDIDIIGAWSFIRWAYTGDGNASDDIYAAAVDGAGCFIYDLNPVIAGGVYGSAVVGGGPSVSTQANYSVVNADISGSTSFSGGLGYDLSAGLFLGLTIGGNLQNGASVSGNLNFSIKGPLGISVMYDPNGGVSFFINVSFGSGASVTTSGTINYGNNELSKDDHDILKQTLNNSIIDSVNKQTQDHIIRNYLE